MRERARRRVTSLLVQVTKALAMSGASMAGYAVDPGCQEPTEPPADLHWGHAEPEVRQSHAAAA